MDTFVLKDGRKVKIDFTKTESILAVKKKDWVEIHAQLKQGLRIICSQLTGTEVYDLLRGGGLYKKRNFIQELAK